MAHIKYTDENSEKRERIIMCLATVSLVLAILGIALGAYGIGRNKGYNVGFQACIEENNLYYRYN